MTFPSTASPAVQPGAPRPSAARRTRRAAGLAVILLLVFVWAAFFRPPFLGGSTHYVTVSGNSMLPTLHPDDLVMLSKHRTYRVGDIIAYTVRDDAQVDGLRVIHRVIGGSEVEGYQTQGDNRDTPDPWRPKARDIMGRRSFVIPKAGLVLRWLKTPLALVLLAILWIVVLFWRPSSGDEPPGTPAPTDTRTVLSAMSAHAPAPAVRRAMRTPSFGERLLRRDVVSHYEDVARALRRRYLLESDAAGRLAIRATAFDLAATYGDRDPRLDRAAFVQACGVLDETAPTFGSRPAPPEANEPSTSARNI